ncbi:MAG: PTS sugar transporter subunit IIA [Candidatus Brocadiia bacterium]
MKFSELISKSAIVKELKASDKKEAIKEIVEVMKNSYKAENLKVSNILDKLMKRERIGSTGIGSGVAVPHAKIEGLQAVLGALGRSSAGIDYDAVDGAPVQLIFVLLTPKNNAELNLQTLQLVARATKQPNFCKFLKEAKDGKEIISILTEFDEVLK